MDDSLSAAEAAKQAKMSLSAIYDAFKNRRLAHYKVSGRGRRGKILIRPSDFKAFLESQRVEVQEKLPTLLHITLPQPS